MKTESSSPRSQQFATFPYPSPDQCSPCTLILSVEDPFQHYPPIYT